MLKKKVIIIFGIIVLLGLVAGGIYYFFKEPPEQNPPGTQVPETKIYRNEEYGFEFRYPADWEVKENAFGSAVSIFNLVIKPIDTPHLPRPIRINILSNDWIEQVLKSFEVDGIESIDVQIDGIDGMRYEHTDAGLSQIDFLVSRGDYWIVVGEKKNT